MCNSFIFIIFIPCPQNGYTALLCAAYGGHTGTCEILLKNNANVNAETKVSHFLYGDLYTVIINYISIIIFK